MKYKKTILIGCLAIVLIAAGCGSSAGNNVEQTTAAEEDAGASITQNDAVEAENDLDSTQASAEGTDKREVAGSETSEASGISEISEASESSEASEISETSNTSETMDSGQTNFIDAEESGQETQDTAESDSVSEYFTNEQLDHIRQSLGIPDDLSVDVEVSDPYYWEGGGMDLVQVDFSHEGEYAAGAACKPYTDEIARNIYIYMGDD